MHAGSPAFSQVTRVGARCFMMINAHIAHDCVVGDACVFANNVSLAGHVTIGEQVWIGGHSAVHQFTRIGAHAFIAGGSMVIADVLPYAVISFEHGHLAGVNVNGLKRRGFTKAQMHTIRAVYRAVFEGTGPMRERVDAARAEFGDAPEAALVLDFIAADAKRPLCHPQR
jgi:UDP-N-acetylglucosamine acyltransferase